MAPRPAPTPAAPERAAAPAETPRLRGDQTAWRRALLERRQALRGEVAALEARAAALAAKIPAPASFRFGVPEAAPAFDGGDWETLARHLIALMRMAPRIVALHLDGRTLPPPLEAEALRHQAPVSAFAIRLGEDLGGVEPQDAFTHPAVLANLVRAVLAVSGLPLDAAQEVRIRVLGIAWAEEEATLDRRLPGDALPLERVLARVDARWRFQRALEEVLTPAQRAVIFDPEMRDRAQLDHFSPAMMHNLRLGAHARDRAHLERVLLQNLFDLAEIEVEDLSPYLWIGREWVDALPGVQRPRAVRDRDLLFTPLADAQRWGYAQAEAMRRILGVGRLTADEAARLRAVKLLLAPRIAPPAPSDD